MNFTLSVIILFFSLSCTVAGKKDTSQSSATQVTVTINITVPQDVFDKNAFVNLSLLNQDDIEAGERNSRKYANCIASSNPQGGTVTSCPGGVVYAPEPVNLEKQSILASKITGLWTISTNHLKSGQKYTISISGLSSDKCNHASASKSGVLQGSVLNLKDLAWATTEMGCLPSTQ